MGANEELVKRSDYENDPEVRAQVDRDIKYSLDHAISYDGKRMSEHDRKVAKKILLDCFLED